MKSKNKIFFFFKRFFDILFSIIALLILSPLLFLVTILNIIIFKGRPFYIQKRIGKKNKFFNIIKFRTMRLDAPTDVPSHMLVNEKDYCNKFGYFLRNSSIDELPQLINILIGDMSFIGPRPALWNQFDLIELRNINGSNLLRPGLTGLAQCSGRDTLSTIEKADFDGKYYINIGFILDIKIFFKTLFVLFRK